MATSKQNPNPNVELTRDFRVTVNALRTDDGGEADAGRRVELSFSSEEPYQRWFGKEILVHEAGAIDLSRLEQIGVLLFNHDPDKPLGSVESVKLDEAKHRCTATVRFDEDEGSDKIYQKVINGTLKGVSVGYRVAVWEEVGDGETSTNGRFTGPCDLATRWTPYEISIVSVPADATVGVGRSAEPETQEKGGTKMDNNLTTGTPKEPEQVTTAQGTPQEPEQRNANSTAQEPEQRNASPDTQNAAADGVRDERQRVNEIIGMCKRFEVDPTQYIADGTTVDAVRAALLDRITADRQAQTVTVQADEADKFRAAATDGLAMRAGIAIDKPAEGANEFQGRSLLRLAAECVERDGQNVRSMDDEELIRAAMTGTGAFPGILSNVAHKSMAQSYQTAPTTFQLWTARGSNTDFKDATRYRLSEADELLPMTETGEFKHAEVTEASAKTSVATYGRTFTMTRKAIINDDMGALSRIPALYGQAARRGINKMVYKILADNPTIEGKALFHADHSNLSTGAITVANLGKAKALMARQTNIRGKEALNVQPAFLIVPPELEVTAAQLINSVVDPSKNNATPNPFANRLTVVADPELADVHAWYLAAAPGILPSIEVTYLNGVEAPTMESHVSFKTLGIEWRIYQDVGVNLIDFRGLLKSSGQ